MKISSLMSNFIITPNVGCWLLPINQISLTTDFAADKSNQSCVTTTAGEIPQIRKK